MGVFSELKPVNHAPRNGFDLGRFSTFSSKVGPIQCVFNQLTEPSSEYELDIQQLCRTSPLQQAAFAGFTINYDVVWTPLNLLYSSFNQFIAQRECKNLAYQPSYQYIPKINLGNFVASVLRYAFIDYVHSFCPEEAMLTFGNPAYGIPYRLVTSEQSPNTSVLLEVIRHLDMFGYGNYLPVLKMMFKAFKSAHPTWDFSDPTIQRSVCNMWSGVADLSDTNVKLNIQSYDSWFANFFYSTGSDWNYIVDLRDVLASIDSSRVGSSDKKVTLWPVLAYNKAFYEYYRNTYYDNKYSLFVFNSVDSSPSTPRYDEEDLDYVKLFNFDDYTPMFDTSSMDLGDSVFTRFLAMFMVKPHLYKRDLFTGVLPSTQFGDVSIMVSQPDWFRMYYKDSILTNPSILGRTSATAQGAIYPLRSDGSAQSNDTTNKYGTAQFNISPQLAISVLESRRADAMQRFRERMLRAGDNVKDIFKAHGWSEPMSEKSYEPIFLGSYDGRIDINTVAVTGAAGDYNVGELAANGVGVVRGQKCRIKTSDFGVLAVYFYISKDAVYNAYGVERQHCLTDPFDFPYPELQNISLKPIVRGELAVIGGNNNNGADHFNDILGYLPADMCFKSAVDKVHGEFFSGGNFSTNPVASVISGVFSDWVTPRHDYEHATELSFLYIHPSCADRIFAMAANDNQDSDQFKINCRFDCYAVEPNTVIGLPI